MDADASAQFITNIIETLHKNGFPEKKVALPLEKMYETAHEKGLNFNVILDFLKQKDIDHEKTTEKIIFFQKQKEEEPASENPFAKAFGTSFDPFQMLSKFKPEDLKNVDMSTMISQAANVFKNMNPEQLANLKKTFESMSEDDKKDLMKKARDMGVIK